MNKEAEYVLSREGQNLLGVNSGRFFYYVNKGDIRREPGSENKRRNVRYSVSDILLLKSKINKNKGLKHISEEGFYVDWIKNLNDVLSSLKLDYQVYGEEIQLEGLPYYTERVRKNPHVALAVYDSESRERILAYISLLPLPEEVVLEILKGERHETEIKNEEIQTYDREGDYVLLAESVVCHPDYSICLNTLLFHLLDFWCNQYPQRFITKIYAQAASNKGDILIRKLYFSPLYNVGRNAYVLDLERPGASRFVRHFQSCLMEKGWHLPEVG